MNLFDNTCIDKGCVDLLRAGDYVKRFFMTKVIIIELVQKVINVRPAFLVIKPVVYNSMFAALEQWGGSLMCLLGYRI